MLFAAAEPNPVDLYKTLVVLQFLGGLVLLGAQLIALARTNKAQKRDVRMVSEAVSKEDFDKHVEENSEASNSARQELVELRAERKADITALHIRINGIDTKVAAVEATTMLTNQRLVQMDGKIDRLMDRGHK
jgi:hypothetical protein